MGEAIRESSIKTWLGIRSELGMFCLFTERKKTILFCVCGRCETGWKETEHQSNMENMDERR